MEFSLVLVTFELMSYVRAISYAVIVQSRDVGGSKTGDISEYSVRTGFLINAVFKWEGWFQTISFDQKKKPSYEKSKRNMK